MFLYRILICLVFGNAFFIHPLRKSRSTGTTLWCAEHDDEGDSFDSSDIVPREDRLRYCARVMYDGYSFRGWQEQPESTARTVQGVLNHRLSKRFGQKIKAVGAGRTDFGVHARGQAIHMDLPPVDDLKKLEFVLNRLLPDDIRLFNLSTAPLTQPRWHATSSAIGKLYSYRFCTNAFVEPMKRRYTAHAYFPLNLTLLNECLQLFVGTYDFNAFANRVTKTTRDYESKSIIFLTTRTVYSITLVEEGGGYYRVDFHLKSALYRMVRNIMGSCFLVAAGQMDRGHLEYLIREAPSRLENKAGSAPPEGLTLEHVYYEQF